MDPNDRPIKSNPSGQYNMKFIDWENEWERLAEEGMPDWYEDSQEDEPEDIQMEHEQGPPVFDQGSATPLSMEYVKKQSMMKMGKSSKLCAICLNNFPKGSVIVKLPCKHIFDKNCILPWFRTKDKCPTCRFDIKKHFEDEENECY